MYSACVATMLVLCHILFNVLPVVGGNEGGEKSKDDRIIEYTDFVKNGLRKVYEKVPIMSGQRNFRSTQVKDICKPSVFYPADPVEIVDNVRAAEDCVVICRRNDKCLTSTYFFMSNKCFMSSAKFGSRVRVIRDVDTQYCEVFHIKHNPEQRGPKQLDPGRSLGCGRRRFPLHPSSRASPSRQKRIIGGEATVPYSFPFVARLENGVNDELTCGATLVAIDDESTSTIFAVTAAHCLVGFRPYIPENEQKPSQISQVLVLYAGSHDVRFSQPHEMVSELKAYFVHPQLMTTKEFGLVNDLAVLVLKNKIDFSWYIGAACLQKPDGFLGRLSSIFKGKNVHAECYTAGWGACSERTNPEEYTERTDECFPYSLLSARTKVTEENSKGVLLTEPVVRGEPTSGDSGGPLLCLSLDRFYLRGVASARDLYQTKYTRTWQERYVFNQITNDQSKWIYKMMNHTLFHVKLWDSTDPESKGHPDAHIYGTPF